MTELILQGKATLEELVDLYEKKDITVVIERGNITGVEYGTRENV